MAMVFTPAEVAKFEHDVWSRCAKRYMDGFGPVVSEAIAPLLDAVRITAGARVLDIGTGPGLVAAAIADRGAVPIGIDFSETMIEEARRRHSGIDFRQAAAEALPFEMGQFDAVVGNFVLHHSSDPAKLLEQAFRVLRNGGRIGFTVWADLMKLEAFGLFFAAMEGQGLAGELPHGPLFGVSDFEVFRGMAGRAGFRDPIVQELPIYWTMSSIDSFLGAFADWAHMEALPENIRAAVEASVRQGAVAYQSAGKLRIPNPAILISAVK
jgi:SAM-dependent methyltransferase